MSRSVLTQTDASEAMARHAGKRFAKPMRLTPHLTGGCEPELRGQINKTYPGMAHWAGSGPFGATCGECAHLGYWRQYRNERGEIVRTAHSAGCARFHQLTHGHGPAVPPQAEACRHCERRNTE
jgi:hypothetical protein